MSDSIKYRGLEKKEIDALEARGCSADDWTKVIVSDPFDSRRFRNATFGGTVKIAAQNGRVKTDHGIEKDCGIYNAVVINSSIGRLTRIANIGSHIANYDIADNVIIEYVGTMETHAGSTFGNGVEVEALNEGGGREVPIFNTLDSQFAYMICVHRFRPDVTKALKAIAAAEAKKAASDRGTVGSGASIVSVKEIIDVAIGADADISGAASLVDGTVLSHPNAPTKIGTDVVAHHFIIGEASKLDSGAVIDKVFIGQGCDVSRQYSAENCLFFANSHVMHGEAVALFGGPYTVSHHKSTLLIAAMTSFYNAGSGTNQSNHMYKLGPVHEGKIERGGKTGSFSYMMWDGAVAPFSVILGKHKAPFDSSDFPFSHVMLDELGKTTIIPGMNLMTVGTVRDGAKWPARDKRAEGFKRDRLTFDVFSPFTIGKLIKSSALLSELSETTDKNVKSIFRKGIHISRPLLKTGVKYYRTGIDMYLIGKIVERLKTAKSLADARKAFAADKDAVYGEDWVDIGGQMMPSTRLKTLHDALASGKINSLEKLNAELDAIRASYDKDEWLWVRHAYKWQYKKSLDELTKDELLADLDNFLKTKAKYLRVVIADAKAEFDDVSRQGFGLDGGDETAKTADFESVRGTPEKNKFAKQMAAELDALEKDVKALMETVTGW